MSTLDAWTHRIRDLTASNLGCFREQAADFDDSEPMWRLCCIARVLEQDCGIHYCVDEQDTANLADWKQSHRHMLHGLLGPQRHGTCASLPLLFAALARRLDYPVRLVFSPGHVFCRWEGLDHPNPAWRERRNIEYSGGIDSHPDEHYYHSPIEWTPTMHEQERLRQPMPLFLRSITPIEEYVYCLQRRAVVLQAHGMYEEAMAVYAKACPLVPHDDRMLYFAKECNRRQVTKILEPWGVTADEFFFRIEKRLKGHKVPYPWEYASGKRRPGRNPFDDPKSAAVIKAAEGAVAARLAGVGKLPPALQLLVERPNEPHAQAQPSPRSSHVRPAELETFTGIVPAARTTTTVTRHYQHPFLRTGTLSDV